jgi:hypothetical protein
MQTPCRDHALFLRVDTLLIALLLPPQRPWCPTATNIDALLSLTFFAACSLLQSRPWPSASSCWQPSLQQSAQAQSSQNVSCGTTQQQQQQQECGQAGGADACSSHCCTGAVLTERQLRSFTSSSTTQEAAAAAVKHQLQQQQQQECDQASGSCRQPSL